MLHLLVPAGYSSGSVVEAAAVAAVAVSAAGPAAAAAVAVVEAAGCPAGSVLESQAAARRPQAGERSQST